MAPVLITEFFKKKSKDNYGFYRIFYQPSFYFLM